jgi:hypothetical protein
MVSRIVVLNESLIGWCQWKEPEARSQKGRGSTSRIEDGEMPSVLILALEDLPLRAQTANYRRTDMIRAELKNIDVGNLQRLDRFSRKLRSAGHLSS